MYGSNSVILNSPKAEEIFSQIKNDIVFYNASFEEVSRHNHQLLEPTKKKSLREDLLKAYVSKGYEAVDSLYYRRMNKKEFIKYKLYFPLKQAIPKNWIKAIKSIKG